MDPLSRKNTHIIKQTSVAAMQHSIIKTIKEGETTIVYFNTCAKMEAEGNERGQAWQDFYFFYIFFFFYC